MNPQVLIVDDSLTVRMDLRITLGAAGFSVTACETKALAQKIIRSQTFALVILDVVLPDGDGIDLLRELRTAPAYMRVPIIMLTTEADVRSRLQGLDAGADEYVGKPYDIERLTRRARELIDQRGAGPQADSSRGRRLLLVDDSPTYLDAIGNVLRQEGYDVVAVTSGEDALRQLAIRRIDGVILDLVMPGIGGMETARRIKRDPALSAIPVMIVTGQDDRRTREEGQRVGVDDFVLKSPELSLLKLRVRGLWRRPRDGGPVEDAPPSSGALPDPPPTSGVQVHAPPSSRSGPGSEPGDARPGSLHERVIALSGLSSVIGPSAIARACKRAGVHAPTMTPAELGRALPTIRETLRVFLAPEDLERRTAAIAALAEWTGTDS